MPADGLTDRGRLRADAMIVSSKPSRKERRIAVPSPHIAEWRGQRQVAIRANGGEGFERHCPGGRDPSPSRRPSRSMLSTTNRRSHITSEYYRPSQL